MLTLTVLNGSTRNLVNLQVPNGFLNDNELINLCYKTDPTQNLLDPFIPNQVTSVDGRKVISYGLSSLGYDLRLDTSISIFKKIPLIDVKNFNPEVCEPEVFEEYFDLPAHGYALGNSIERFNMPDNLGAICLTKSTYARAGLLVNVTPVEPGWEGYLTIEIANLTDSPIRVYTNEGIAQILFYKLCAPNVTYRSRGGKYQNQVKLPVTPKLK